MKNIIEKYCKSYSHGTKSGKGKVIRENWETNTEAEFQFSFDIGDKRKNNGELYSGQKIWESLKPFVYSEQELINKFK